MANTPNVITPTPIENYCIAHSTPPNDLQFKLIDRTHQEFRQAARMQVGALEGRFLTLITQLIRARSILELGTFTGYSALAFAEGLPEDGKVVTLDIDPKATIVAQEAWGGSPHGKKIELKLGSALETLQALRDQIAVGARQRFDLVFIDADKGNYPHYYEAALELIPHGGVILVDNVLWSGAVLDPKEKNDQQIADFNDKVSTDTRVEKIMLPIRDGIYLIRKK
jgi:caffeoyl-CoA O-methyltransferase